MTEIDHNTVAPHYMINTNLLFLHWWLDWSPDETVKNLLVRLKHTVLNSPTAAGGQIKLNYIGNNKVDTISELWFPQNITGSQVSL